MASTITIEQIKREILSDPELKKAARKLAIESVVQNRALLIEEFNSHPVTREIESGPDAGNISGTLGNKGNLFSFIGFATGSNPIVPIRKLLEKIKLSSREPVQKGGNFEFKVDAPSTEEFESITKMPWESGRSWLFDIERAISGLSHYLYGAYNQKSRSGTGLQLDSNVTSMTFSPVKYFGEMIANFSRRLK
jgi:hypothetical protein